MAKNFSVSLGKKVHETPYRVIYGDTDAAGIMYNANYLRLFEIGRTELMRAWAIPYQQIEELGYVLPVTESYIRFKAPARYDEVVTIATSLTEATPNTCRFHYAVKREETEGEQLLVRGFTKLACIDSEGKLSRFPEEIMRLIAPLVE